MEDKKDNVKVSIKTSGIEDPNSAWIEYTTSNNEHVNVYSTVSLKYGTYINIACNIPEGKAVKKVIVNSLNVLMTPQQVYANSDSYDRTILVSINNVIADLDIEVVFGNEERITSWDFYQDGLFEVWSSDYFNDLGDSAEDGTHKWPEDNHGTGKQYKNGDIIEDDVEALYIFPKNISTFKVGGLLYKYNTKYNLANHIDPEEYNNLLSYGDVYVNLTDSHFMGRSIHIVSVNDKSYSTITNNDHTKIHIENTKISCTAGDYGAFLYWYTANKNDSNRVYIYMFSENTIDFYDNRIYTSIFKNYDNLDIIKIKLHKRCLNCLDHHSLICSLPKEFISDILLIDTIDTAIASGNTYILDNIVDKFSNIYPYEQCKSKCQLCK